MNIVLFAHPAFTAHQSMPRFARMLAEGMKARGHQVEVRAPQGRLVRLPLPKLWNKWLGYIDQYLAFPFEMRSKLKEDPADTLFVFTDHALGPWVPLVANRPHVIHCHDFLAQRSALGEIPENPTSWTGRQYQAYIRQGYSQGRNFISVSETTRHDLHRFLPAQPATSDMVYNGLNQTFVPHNIIEARTALGNKLGLDATLGYLLHVGGNQWYKHRKGVLELYNAWRDFSMSSLPLLMVGEAPDEELSKSWQYSPYQQDIHWLSGLSDELVRLAYAGASVFLFPSLAEGFGWPIAEAMAAGCPVITTGTAPMTEVGGDSAFYIPRHLANENITGWAREGAQVIEQVVTLDSVQRSKVAEAGLANARRFDADATLNRMEAIYQHILATY